LGMGQAAADWQPSLGSLLVRASNLGVCT
jgi:hypothetical protein